MTRLKNLLLAAGLGLALYSTPSFARESILDRVKDRVKETTDKAKEEAKKARERARRTADKVKEDYQKTREQLSRTRKKLGETARRASEFTREATKGMSLKDITMEARIITAENVPVINTETGKITTFNTLVKEMTASEAFKGSDYEKYPVRVAVGLLYDTENAFSKYKIINADGEWLTMNEAITHLNKQQRDLMRELGRQPTRTTQTSTRSVHKRHSTSSSGLEKVINREYTLNRSNWWEIDRNIYFGDKKINITSDRPVQSASEPTAGAPINLHIDCNAKGNNATDSTISLTSQRDSDTSWYRGGMYDGDSPRRGAEYEIYNSDDGKIKLKITDYQYSGSGDNRVISKLSFRVFGALKQPQPKSIALQRTNTTSSHSKQLGGLECKIEKIRLRPDSYYNDQPDDNAYFFKDPKTNNWKFSHVIDKYKWIYAGTGIEDKVMRDIKERDKQIKPKITFIKKLDLPKFYNPKEQTNESLIIEETRLKADKYYGKNGWDKIYSRLNPKTKEKTFLYVLGYDGKTYFGYGMERIARTFQRKTLPKEINSSIKQKHQKTQSTGLEPRVARYLEKNPGSRLLDISILLGSSSKAKDGLSYLLEQRKIKIQDHKYYPTK